MSHQPSTTDKVKDAASSAYESLVNTVSPVSENQGKYDPDKDKSNFAKDSHGNIFKKGDYKDKLNEAARGSPPQAEEGYVEKGVSSLKQSDNDQGGPEKDVKNNEEQPKRPEHDVQVEQFLRKQYHSTAGDGMPEPGKR